MNYLIVDIDIYKDNIYINNPSYKICTALSRMIFRCRDDREMLVTIVTPGVRGGRHASNNIKSKQYKKNSELNSAKPN